MVHEWIHAGIRMYTCVCVYALVSRSHARIHHARVLLCVHVIHTQYTYHTQHNHMHAHLNRTKFTCACTFPCLHVRVCVRVCRAQVQEEKAGNQGLLRALSHWRRARRLAAEERRGTVAKETVGGFGRRKGEVAALFLHKYAQRVDLGWGRLATKFLPRPFIAFVSACGEINSGTEMCFDTHSRCTTHAEMHMCRMQHMDTHTLFGRRVISVGTGRRHFCSHHEGGAQQSVGAGCGPSRGLSRRLRPRL